MMKVLSQKWMNLNQLDFNISSEQEEKIKKIKENSSLTQEGGSEEKILIDS